MLTTTINDNDPPSRPKYRPTSPYNLTVSNLIPRFTYPRESRSDPADREPFQSTAPPSPRRLFNNMANLGVPVKLLHESVGHVVTVELKTGQVSPPSPGVSCSGSVAYRGIWTSLGLMICRILIASRP